MYKKLPSIYKENNINIINNNKKVFYSSKKEEIKNESNFNIEDFYSFNTPVLIETLNEAIKSKIVSKLNDHILTSDNRIIKLKDIKNIKVL